MTVYAAFFAGLGTFLAFVLPPEPLRELFALFRDIIINLLATS
ncbi:hypothetical protein C943_03322 [Mariniradius saccharolyticus AK6]|uniref:Uncharacterized protein n=2 Tax=Mariniradius TaxID=1245590 RepID=M7XB26_9BACT|nr:hypothetical protein C943_03322 [Mariniradius saccharolyticus AK6]